MVKSYILIGTKQDTGVFNFFYTVYFVLKYSKSSEGQEDK